MFLAIARFEMSTAIWQAASLPDLWRELALEVDRSVGDPDGSTDPGEILRIKEWFADADADLLIVETAGGSDEEPQIVYEA